MKIARWFGLALLLSLWTWSGAAGAASGGTPKALSARRDGNYVRVNSQPTMLLWARGLTDADDLESYAAVGLNTVAIPITDVSEEGLKKASALATAAEARGLMVVGVLAPSKLSDEEGGAVDTDPVLEAYPGAVRAFVEKAVGALGRHPRLIAWIAEVRPEQVVWGSPGFRRYLGGLYRDVEELNDSWGSEYDDFGRVSTDGVRDLDGDRTGGVGRASVDYAQYRQKTYTDAVAVWTSSLRQTDPKRLVLVGGVTDYRSAIGLERGLDGLVMETTPGVAETDYFTANVQAVDVARRGNRLVAVQTLDLSTSSASNRVRDWIHLALVHGASGLQFADWGDLQASEELQATVKQAADLIEESGEFPARPVARTAVLYEPYAGGAMTRNISLYGYLEGMTDREPSSLFAMVRNGSRYGLVDVLSLESLSQADLDQYGALFVPMAFFLPDKAQAALHQFALEGGVLVADAGVGMYQATGVVGALPEILRETFGLPEDAPETPDDQPTPEVNPNGTIPAPPAAIGAGDQGRERAQQDQETMIRELYAMLQAPDVSKTLGVDFGGPDSPGMRARKLGKGMVVYAPTFLYQQWAADRDDYAQFHDRVLGWRPDVRVGQPDQLWPPVEVSSTADGTVTLVTPGSVPTALRRYGETSQLYLVPGGAVRVWEPVADEATELLFPGEPIALARPLPITLVPQGEEASATVVVRQYDAGKVELDIFGTDAEAHPSGGVISLSGGVVTPMTLTLENGTFPITPGASYHVLVEDRGRAIADYTAMPDPESKTLTIQNKFRASRVTITPGG